MAKKVSQSEGINIVFFISLSEFSDFLQKFQFQARVLDSAQNMFYLQIFAEILLDIKSWICLNKFCSS